MTTCSAPGTGARAAGAPQPTHCRSSGSAVPIAEPRAPLPAPRTQAEPTAARPAAPFPRAQAAPPAMAQPANPSAAPLPPCKRGASAGPRPTAAAHIPVAKRPRPEPSPQAQGAATSSPSPSPAVGYVGVGRGPDGKWMAHVVDPKRRAARAIGPFPHAHAAALAHDRAAIAAHGDGARALNFRPAFHRLEREFLGMLERTEKADLCGALQDGTYEREYARFLGEVYHQTLNRPGCDRFFDVVLEFFFDRAEEIGSEALEAGGQKLAARFVEMHRNRATDGVWRQCFHRMVREMQQQQRQMKMVQKQSMMAIPWYKHCS